MKPAGTLAAFAAGLAAVFVTSLGVGAVGPVAAVQPTSGHKDADRHADDDHADNADDAHAAHGAGTAPAGLAVADAGWRLELADDRVAAGAAVPFRFTINAPDGTPETGYVRTHTKELHLIVVRRDLASYQHVHPVRAADGSWSVPLELPAGGTYRVFADFRPRGLDRNLTLGADLSVPGRFAPQKLPAPSRSTTVGDYDITLAGTPVAGRESDLVMSVSRAGAPVTDLQPYLGAYGHLVALRADDLAYLHTHPEGHAEPGHVGGPDVAFATTFPTAGSYRLFVDFQVGGVVRTAAFTVEVGEAP